MKKGDLETHVGLLNEAYLGSLPEYFRQWTDRIVV